MMSQLLKIFNKIKKRKKNVTSLILIFIIIITLS